MNQEVVNILIESKEDIWNNDEFDKDGDYLVTALAVAAAVPLGSMGKLINAMRIGSFIVIKDLDNIKVLVDKLGFSKEVEDITHKLEFQKTSYLDLGNSLRDGGGRVCRGKWGPLVAESGEGGGWEEEVGGVMVVKEIE
ncbi:UPF0496 protein-like protein [Tanacetum coccineum]